MVVFDHHTTADLSRSLEIKVVIKTTDCKSKVLQEVSQKKKSCTSMHVAFLTPCLDMHTCKWHKPKISCKNEYAKGLALPFLF